MSTSLHSCASRQQKRDCRHRKMETKAAFSSIQSSQYYSCFLLSFLLAFLLLISNVQTSLAATTTKSSSSTYKTFIKTSCNSTTYPEVCYKTLSPFYATIKTDPRMLCYISLNETLKTARKASSLLSSIAKQGGLSSDEKAVLRDCKEEVGDSIDALKDSMEEMDYLDSSDAHFHQSNMQTWVSGAITDENTCTDEFEEKEVRKSVQTKIKKSVVNLARQTSNSLAIINHIQY